MAGFTGIRTLSATPAKLFIANLATELITRMFGRVQLTLPFIGYASVYLGRRDAGVAEQLLYCPQISASIKHVCGERMPQAMCAHLSLNIVDGGMFSDDESNCFRAYLTPPGRQKHIAVSIVPPKRGSRSAEIEVEPER